MNVVLVLISLLAAQKTSGQLQCGVQSVAPRVDGQRSRFIRIVNGKEARAHSWPWQIGLVDYGEFGNCGGTLVSSTAVVTAAHCFDGQKVTDVDGLGIRAGDHRRSVVEPGEQTVAVAKIILHPNYKKRTRENDIAILKLQQPVTLDATKQVVCLPNAGQLVPPGTPCVATGWGNTDRKVDDSLSDTLQQGLVQIFNDTVCNDRRHYGGRVKTGVAFCAGTFVAPFVDTCDSDSGGPLVCLGADGSWVLQGVTSWGDDCGTASSPGVYTRVSPFVAWIQQNMQ